VLGLVEGDVKVGIVAVHVGDEEGRRFGDLLHDVTIWVYERRRHDA
jgi:hypothetical protein